MCRNSIIHIDVNILVTMEGLVFIYCFTDVDRIWALWKQCEPADQQNNVNKRGNGADIERHQKMPEKRAVVTLLPNREHRCSKNKWTQFRNKHSSRYWNLLLNQALKSLTCVMFLVGPFSSDLIRCIIPNSMDIYLSMDSYHLRRFWYPLESSALLDRDLSVSF